MTKQYTKNQSIGIPENAVGIKEYKDAVKAKKGRNKYNAKKTNINGYIYDSQLEASYGIELEHRLALGEIKSYERQIRLDLVINGKKWRSYKIDFKVHHFDSPPEYVEVKGFPTRDWKMKFDVLKIIRDDILEKGATITVQYKNKRQTF